MHTILIGINARNQTDLLRKNHEENLWMIIRLLQALPYDLEYRDCFENFGRKCVGRVISKIIRCVVSLSNEKSW